MSFIYDIYWCNTNMLCLLHMVLQFLALPLTGLVEMGKSIGFITGTSGPWTWTCWTWNKAPQFFKEKEVGNTSKEKWIKACGWCTKNNSILLQYIFYCEFTGTCSIESSECNSLEELHVKYFLTHSYCEIGMSYFNFCSFLHALPVFHLGWRQTSIW